MTGQTDRQKAGRWRSHSGIELNVLKAWLARGVIELDRYDLEASGKGSSRLFTLRTVLGIALMAELVRLGLPPQRAAAPALNSVKINFRDRKSPTPNTDCLLLVFPTNVGKFNQQETQTKTQKIAATNPNEPSGFIATLRGDPSTGFITDTVWSVLSPDEKVSIHGIITLARRMFSNPPASVATVSIPAVLEQVRRVLSARGKLDEEI